MITIVIATILMACFGVYYGARVFKISQRQFKRRNERAEGCIQELELMELPEDKKEIIHLVRELETLVESGLSVELSITARELVIQKRDELEYL